MSSRKNSTDPHLLACTGYAPRGKRSGKDGDKASKYWLRDIEMSNLKNYIRASDETAIRNHWECSAQKKALYSSVRWKMEQVGDMMDRDLQRRRDKLSELLQKESSQYSQEKLPESEGSMRTRLEELQRQKEKERRLVVQEKREQQFRENCHELRDLVSRRLQEQAAMEGQIIRREDLRNSEQEPAEPAEEQWDQMEEQEERRRRGKEYGEEMVKQMRRKEEEKAREKMEKVEEAEMMAEVKRLSDLESEYEKERKRRNRLKTKADLDECVKCKTERRGEEDKEDLLQDHFFLQQMADENERKHNQEKKRALFGEQRAYLDHLRNQADLEQRERDRAEQMYAEEQERVWEERRRGREAEKRSKMREEVRRGVGEQLEDKQSEESARFEREWGARMLREDEEWRREDARTRHLTRKNNLRYQQDLRDQIQSKEELSEVRRQREEGEREELSRARAEEEDKVRTLLSQMDIHHEHPYRTARREMFDQCSS